MTHVSPDDVFDVEDADKALSLVLFEASEKIPVGVLLLLMMTKASFIAHTFLDDSENPIEVLGNLLDKGIFIDMLQRKKYEKL